MDPAPQRRAGIAFGGFVVLPERRDLLADGRPIKLGGRAFDVLMALIEVPGTVVSKDALIARVWPNRMAEEDNLTAQIVALRKALGSERGLVRTVAGRGYQFIGETRLLPASTDQARDVAAVAAAEVTIRPPTNLPEQVTELIGRKEELAELLGLLATHRFVCLTGPGGIGKTRLALAAARQLLTEFADGVWVAELSAIADPDLVSATVAAAVGLQLGAGEISPQRVAQELAHRRLLLILDTCEHVIDTAAAMAEALLQAGPRVRIIATSRESLRAEGERIYQVLPLALPAADSEDPWQFGAVRLFVARPHASGVHIAEDQRTAPAIAGICRRLDGIPLAIELAAARAATLGIEQLAARLDNRFDVLTGGRRTALARQQTLRATLDWSYELLSEPERVILRRLAVFAGPFDVAAVSAVAGESELAQAEVVERLSDLVAKSLVAAEVKGPIVRYRLLDTTRAYTLEKLDESGEREQLLRCHAEYYRHLFERAEVEWEASPTAEWLEDHSRCIDNLRAALDWAFSPKGDASIGVALTAAAEPLWTHLSLVSERRRRTEQALAAFGASEDGDPRCEMKLYLALASSSYWDKTSAQVVMLWTKALAIAESLDDAEYQLRSRWGLSSFHFGSGEFQLGLEMTESFRALAARHKRRDDELIAERLIAVAQHLLGDQTSARRHVEHVLANSIPSDTKSYTAIRFQFDQGVAMRTCLARVLLLQGFPDEAVRNAKCAVDEAREINHPLSLCYTLSSAACIVMLWVGDLAAAEHYIAMLLDHSASLALPYWGALGRCIQAVFVIRSGDLGPGLRQLRAGFDELDGPMAEWSSTWFLGELANGFARAGQIADGLVASEQATERAERTKARWLYPELLRTKGELVLSQAETGAVAAAKDHFKRALDAARLQGALSLELRAATSLARLLRNQRRSADAKLLLQSVYDRFTEGFETADLKAAKALLNTLE